MTLLRLVSFDPGKSSGIAQATLHPDGTLEWTNTWQVSGGADGLKRFLKEWDRALRGTLISEKFIPFGIKGARFTLDSLEPLRGEGVLIALGFMPDYSNDEPRWQVPSKQYMYGGKTKAEKRKLAKEFLKKHGWYLTGKDVGQKDAEDAISARLHIIYYIAHTLRHKPFWDLYFEGVDK